MKMNSFKLTWGQAIRENNVKSGLIVLLIVGLVISLTGWFQSHETIVLVPPNLESRATVSASEASDGYVKSWALFIAELAGNITPGNADFVMNSMKELLSPDAYRSIRDSLAKQIGDIKTDSLTVGFEPRQTVYEPSSKKVFVYGQFSSQGSSGNALKSMRTYEMKIDVRFGRPWVTAFVPYSGVPKTEGYWKSAPREERVEAERTVKETAVETSVPAATTVNAASDMNAAPESVKQ